MPDDVIPDFKKHTAAVQEASASQRNGDPTKGSPKTPQYDSAVMLRRVSWDLVLYTHDAERRQSL